LRGVEGLFGGITLKRECDIHPHDWREKSGEFSSLDATSAEVEVLIMLHALVRMFKPHLALETGTGIGMTTIAIANAMSENGHGHLHTIEIDSSNVETSKYNLHVIDGKLEDWVSYHTADTREFIDSWDGVAFDFALFDSDVAFRHIEYEKLMARGLLAPGAICCFHDTSRLRGETMNDFNPGMIAALDSHSQGKQWLESECSRGFRLLRVPQ
jgi:predicted O-methyltransferase YrrM